MYPYLSDKVFKTSISMSSVLHFSIQLVTFLARTHFDDRFNTFLKSHINNLQTVLSDF